MEKSLIEKIKILRSQTNIGFLECKEALENTNENIEEAVIFLRKKGILKIESKNLRRTSHGSISVLNDNKIKKSVILEVNCETDFAAKSIDFLNYTKKISEFLLYNFEYKNNINEEIDSNHYLNEEKLNIISKIGENICIKRVKYFNNKNSFHFGYTHGINNVNKIGAVLILNEESKEHIDIVKDLSMQIVATKPIYIRETDIPEKILISEKKIYLTSAKEKYPEKNEEIINKIVEKQMEDFLTEFVLLKQNFIKNQSIKIKNIVENKINLIDFSRFEVGEIN